MGVTAADGEETTYTYSYEYLASIEFPGAASDTSTITFEYDSSGRITTVTQEPQIVTTFEYLPGSTEVTDANGHTSTYAIDSQGRVTATKDALGRERSQTWTADNAIATTTDALASHTTTYTYDQTGNRTGAQLPTGAASAAIYALGPDCNAPDTGTTYQIKCSVSASGATTQYEYDQYGQIIKKTDTSDTTPVDEFTYTYAAPGSGTSGYGNPVTATDANGKTTQYTYDDGLLVKVTPPAPLGETTYSYDSLNRVTSVTDGRGLTTSYSYDLRDRPVLTTHTNDQAIYKTYYPNGLEEYVADYSSNAAQYTYDSQGRLARQTGPHIGAAQEYTYDDVGNMLTFTDSAGTVTYTYDDSNQLTSIREPGGTCPSSGNPAANSGCVLLEYDDNSNETKRIYPAGAHTDTTRDASGRPIRITAKATDGSTAVDIGYSYAAPGSGDDQINIQTRTSHKEEGITAGAVTTYSYDNRNRLTNAEEKDGSTLTAAWSYGYDNAGNRTTQTRTGATGQIAGTIDYTYNDANQMTSATGQSTSWTYDAAGNQTRNGLTGATITYGPRGEATAFGSTGADYFGTGNTDRLSRGNTTFANGPLGMTQRTSGSTTHTYTRSPEGEPLGMRASASYYYVADQLGSVAGLFSATGTWIGGYTYSPYGEARFTSTSSVITNNALRYIGEHHDGAGIYKLGARYYDTAQGRFTQMDPSGQEANPYEYAGCNPVNSIDPSGLAACTAAAGIAGVLHGVIWSAAAGAAFTGGASIGAGIVVGLVVGSFWFAVSEFGCSS
nr:RHS repeat-associated core domain-containing protein [Microbacterium halimionae]